MDDMNSIQNGEVMRRKSLLPQRRSVQQTSARRNTIIDQSASKTNLKGPPAVKSEDATASCLPARRTSMLPPPRLGRSSSVHVSTQVTNQRRLRTDRTPFQNPVGASEHMNKGGTRREAPSIPKVASRGRSVSHQVERSAVPSSIPTQHSSTKVQRRPSTSMQKSSTLKRSVTSRPSSPSRNVQSADKDSTHMSGMYQLQGELAQLHLLHRTSHLIQRQWESSAQSAFESRFSAISERYIELKEIANQQQQLMNQLALIQWAQGRSSGQVAEKVALLSQNIADVCSLTSPGGKYSRILADFEVWFAQALEKRQRRQPGPAAEGSDIDLIEDIGDGWKAEAMVLERELTYLMQDIKAFGSVRSSSSLNRLHSLYKRLVLNLVEELDIIQWIENEITAQETSCLNDEINQLAWDA
ncbi:hypothetical protein ACLMJK_006591 [Lecanora helva]